jgi:iron complex outermembrane receptor protein
MRAIATVSTLIPLLCGVSAIAQADGAAAPDGALEEVVVTATRVATPAFDQPVSIDSVGRGEIADGRLQVNLSEALGLIPGIVVQNRQNYAQDQQVSSRGFGSHTTFGVVGVRIYIDGIPATQPDGQGQVSNIDLGSAERVEVLRGPFSALYGNSAGGVISVFTEDGRPGTELETSADGGSLGQQRYGMKLSGDEDGVNYVADADDFRTDGLRTHSAANKGLFNGKLRFTLDDSSQLTLVANAINVEAQDPMGLTRSQFDSDPSQAGTGAVAFDTRKTVNQEQFGVIYTRAVGDEDSLTALAYGGHRAITQYQSIPVATELPPTSPGGVIDLAIGYWGGDFHWTDRRELAGMKLEVTGGASYDMLDEARRGYRNFVGSTLGIEGALRRDETDDVFDVDEYVQAQLEPDPQWLLEAGVRNSHVPVTSTDHYIPHVPQGGGAVTYDATTPVAGITFRADPKVNLYASYGEGFQTPTLDQLAYRSTNGSLPGLNLALKPSRSENEEVGFKARLDDTIEANLAGFHIDTSDEIATIASSFGRAVYQNVGRTTRDGAELGIRGHWADGLGAGLAYTWLRATYATSFKSCAAVPCIPVVTRAGNRLPGVPLDQAYGELTWADPAGGFSAGLEEQVRGKVYVNDLDTDAAPAYAITNLRLGYAHEFGATQLQEFLRFDNLFDRRYAGTVIVNDTNGRYFEPAPGFAVYAGLTVRFGS